MVPWPFADDPDDVQVTNHFQQQDPTSPPSSDDYFTSEDDEQTVSRDGRQYHEMEDSNEMEDSITRWRIVPRNGGQYQEMACFKGYLNILRNINSPSFSQLSKSGHTMT